VNTYLYIKIAVSTLLLILVSTLWERINVLPVSGRGSAKVNAVAEYALPLISVRSGVRCTAPVGVWKIICSNCGNDLSQLYIFPPLASTSVDADGGIERNVNTIAKAIAVSTLTLRFI
jgi:hypothetical protein